MLSKNQKLTSLSKYAILAEKYDDQNRAIYFKLGECSLQNLIEDIKKEEVQEKIGTEKVMELLIELSKVTFKVVSTVILDLFNEKLFHTDIKPQNIVM